MEYYQLLSQILRGSGEKKASDIHFTVGMPCLYRLDGELIKSDTQNMSSEDIEAMAKLLMGEVQKQVLERDGEVDFSYSLEGTGRFRINIYREMGNLAMAMRLLSDDIPEPASLGIPEPVRQVAHLKRGLVLVTGATGSGKSATLASLINVINNTYSKHIITLEDPIEYIHKNNYSVVNQRELGSDTMSFAAALRAALRQDPDVILVGEMRDLETIATAITAAETGHLVFSTVHTNDAASTIDRIIDVFPAYQHQQIRVQLANVLQCVVSQQLLQSKAGTGRVCAFEVLMCNNAIANLIRENKSFQIPTIMQTSKKEGMQLMDDALYDLVMRNKISESDAIMNAHNLLNLEKRLII